MYPWRMPEGYRASFWFTLGLLLVDLGLIGWNVWWWLNAGSWINAAAALFVVGVMGWMVRGYRRSWWSTEAHLERMRVMDADLARMMQRMSARYN